MLKFKNKKIETIESLGEKIKRHRESQGLNLEKIARKLQINSRYLKALENDDYKNLPAEIYTKNFIRRYSNLLNINEASAIALFNKEKKFFEKTSAKVPLKYKNSKKTFLSRFIHFVLTPSTIKYSFIALIFIIIAFYITFSINKIFSPPELIIKYPVENNIITMDNSITVEGVTEKEVELTINSKQILYDEDGRFKTTLDLHKDLNMIKIVAKKKHSKSNIIYKQVIVRNKPSEN